MYIIPHPNSMDLMLVFILEAAPAAGSSRFHILDLLTNNFFLAITDCYFFINYVLSAESAIDHLKLIARCFQKTPNL